MGPPCVREAWGISLLQRIPSEHRSWNCKVSGKSSAICTVSNTCVKKDTTKEIKIIETEQWDWGSPDLQDRLA